MMYSSNEDNFQRAVDVCVTKAKFLNVKSKQIVRTPAVKGRTIKPAVSYPIRPYDSFLTVPQICFCSVPLLSFTSMPATAFSSKQEIRTTAYRSKPKMKKRTKQKQIAQSSGGRPLRPPYKVGFINTKDGENNERSTKLEPSMSCCLHSVSNQGHSSTDKLEKRSEHWTVKSLPGENISTQKLDKKNYRSKNETKNGLETNSYPLSFNFIRIPTEALPDVKESTRHRDDETIVTKTETKNSLQTNFSSYCFNFGRIPSKPLPDEKESTGHRDKETTVNKTETKDGLETQSYPLSFNFGRIPTKPLPDEKESSGHRDKENTAIKSKTKNDLEVNSCSNPFYFLPPSIKSLPGENELTSHRGKENSINENEAKNSRKMSPSSGGVPIKTVDAKIAVPLLEKKGDTSASVWQICPEISSTKPNNSIYFGKIPVKSSPEEYKCALLQEKESVLNKSERKSDLHILCNPNPPFCFDLTRTKTIREEKISTTLPIYKENSINISEAKNDLEISSDSKSIFSVDRVYIEQSAEDKDRLDKKSYMTAIVGKTDLRMSSYQNSSGCSDVMFMKPLLEEKINTYLSKSKRSFCENGENNLQILSNTNSFSVGGILINSLSEEEDISINPHGNKNFLNTDAMKNSLEISSSLNRSFNSFKKNSKPPEFGSINRRTLGLQFVFFERMDELELSSNTKPPLSLTFGEYHSQKVDQTRFKVTKSCNERKSYLQIPKEIKNSIFASDEYDYQNDIKMCSSVQMLERDVNFQTFYMNEIDKSEKNIFNKKIRTLKNKLDSILVKFSKTDLELSEIVNRVHEKVLITSDRHTPTCSCILYSNKLPRLSFPEKLESLNTKDVILPHISPKAASSCIFSTRRNYCSISYQDTCRCNNSTRNRVSDTASCILPNTYSPRNRVSDTASCILPNTSKTHNSDGNSNEKCDEDIVIGLDTSAYLRFELQKSQQLLSDIEKSYGRIRKLFESSWSVKSKGAQNKSTIPKNDSHDKNMHSCRNLSRCINNSTECVVSDFDKSSSAEFLCNTKDDALDHSNEESEASFSSKCPSTEQMRLTAKCPSTEQIRLTAECGTLKKILPTPAVPPVQTSKNFNREKITVYKSVFSQNIEKPVIKPVDAFSLCRETLYCKNILNSIDSTYETVRNEISSWLRDMKSAKNDDAISRNRSIDHDAGKHNLDYMQPEDKGRSVNGDCLMRFKAGNFSNSTLDWSLNDTSDSELSIISEEESELDDSESSLDGSFRQWLSDSRGSTDSEDSDCVSIPDSSKTLTLVSDAPRILNFSGDLHIKIEAKATLSAKSNMLPKNFQANTDGIGSMLIQSLQHLYRDRSMKGSKKYTERG